MVNPLMKMITNTQGAPRRKAPAATSTYGLDHIIHDGTTGQARPSPGCAWVVGLEKAGEIVVEFLPLFHGHVLDASCRRPFP